MARRDGTLVAGITAYADGPEEMREVIRHHVNIGVDQVKLSMSGEEVRLFTFIVLYKKAQINNNRLLKQNRHKIVTTPMTKQQLAWMKPTAWVQDSVLMQGHATRSRCASDMASILYITHPTPTTREWRCSMQRKISIL